MKKLILATVIAFAIMGCKKENSLDTPQSNSNNPQEFVIPTNEKISATSEDPCVIYFAQEDKVDTGVVHTVYKINSDGSGLAKAFDFRYPMYGIKVSPDGKYVPFSTYNLTTKEDHLLLYDIENDDTLSLGLVNTNASNETMPVSFWMDNENFFYENYKTKKAYLFNIKTKTQKEITLPVDKYFSRMAILNKKEIVDLHNMAVDIYDLNFNKKRIDSLDVQFKGFYWPDASVRNNRIGYNSIKKNYVVVTDNKTVFNLNETGIKTTGPIRAMGPYGKWVYANIRKVITDEISRIALCRISIDNPQVIEEIMINYYDYRDGKTPRIYSTEGLNTFWAGNN